MIVYPKFIIETDSNIGDFLLIASCEYHKEIATDIKKVKGGGWWILDKKNSTFTFYGESHDFGKVNISDISNCVKNKKVFTSPEVMESPKDFKFLYKNEEGNIFDLETFMNNASDI